MKSNFVDYEFYTFLPTKLDVFSVRWVNLKGIFLKRQTLWYVLHFYINKHITCIKITDMSQKDIICC